MDDFVRFENLCCRTGYAVGVGQLKDGTEMPVVVTATDRPTFRSVALQNTPTAFRTFATTVTDLPSTLAFANSFGLLGRPREDFQVIDVEDERGYRPGSIAESVDQWIKAAAELRNALEIWQALRGSPKHDKWRALLKPYLLDRDIFLSPTDPLAAVLMRRDEDRFVAAWEKRRYHRAARLLLGFIVSSQLLRLHVMPTLAVEPSQHSVSVLLLRPPTLLGALWLQFAQAVAQNKQYRACKGCGKFMELHWPEGFRKHRTTCSDACRSKVYRERRPKRKRKTVAGK